MRRHGARRAFSLLAYRRRRCWTLAITLVVIVAIIIADQRGWLLARHSDDLARYHGRWAPVHRVIDGDTLDIAIADPAHDSATSTRIRLWGIDCPEMAMFNQAEQPWARQATERARELVEGREVLLFLEPQRERDSYGRVLAHAELRDGRSLNELLLEAGLAKADDRWPHARLTRYAQVELAARRAEAGMWSPQSSPLENDNARRTPP